MAAAFEAVAKLPGIVLDDEVDALGRHGIGITYPGMSFGLVFDRDTYAYLGLRLEGIKGQKKFLEVKGLVQTGVVDSMGGRP